MFKMNYYSLLCLFLHLSQIQPKNLKLFRQAGGEIPFSRIPATCCFKLFMSLNSFASKTFGHISKNLTELKNPRRKIISEFQSQILGLKMLQLNKKAEYNFCIFPISHGALQSNSGNGLYRYTQLKA